MKYYIICSTSRSGTHLLCSILRQLEGGIGYPFEIFYCANRLFQGGNISHLLENQVRENKIAYPGEVKDVLGWIYQIGSRNNIWGSVLLRDHYGFLIKGLKDILGRDIGDFRLFNTLFPDVKFVFLHRINKIKQAISLEKAYQQKSYVQRDKLETDLKYDREKITSHILQYIRYESDWLRFFDSNDIVPHIITYEDLCADKSSTVEKLLDFLEIQLSSHQTLSDRIDCMELSIQQYDEINRDWYRKYIRGLT